MHLKIRQRAVARCRSIDASGANRSLAGLQARRGTFEGTMIFRDLNKIENPALKKRLEAALEKQREADEARRQRPTPVEKEPAADAKAEPAKKGRGKNKPGRQNATRTRVGPFVFDSETEANVFMQARLRGQIVFVQPRFALSDDCYFEIDFIMVEEVLPDGRFIARVWDGKAFSKGKNGEMRAFVQEDAKIKKKWFEDKTRIKLGYCDHKGNKS